MDSILQNTFYVLGIIFMVLNIAILISIATALLYLKKKIDEIHQSIDDKIDTVRAVADQPSVFARSAGAVAANVLSLVLSRFFARKNK